MKKTLFILTLLMVMGMGINHHLNEVAAAENDAVMKQYISCLKENFTQRDYCGKKVGKNYMVLDQQLQSYGYSYEVRGYDLVLVKNK